MHVTIDGIPFVPAYDSASQIGIEITIPNRPDVLKCSIENHLKYLPFGALAVVINVGS